ncbi:MAG: DNA-processing protein DprA [Lachnospiraceae bacterium]|nr:DNA-processing protein DprA [Lachnospiraceae bacterium]
MEKNIKYDYWWAGMERYFPARLKMPVMEAGSSKRLYEMDKEELINIEGISTNYAESIVEKRKRWDIDAEYEKLLSMGIDFIPFYDERYPKRLINTPGHPFAVFSMGKLPGDDKHSVAIIGARNCSEYGRMQAQHFGTELAGYGVNVISGMAYGIDGVAQEAALKVSDRVYGILGCGVNICYPAANRRLYELLKEKGGLLSEYGIYTKPRSCLFPPRNRIISALAQVVLVVEAREMSGTMITVDMALEQGKEVAVVPGRVSDPLSTGCNKLIKQGAAAVTCAEDVMYMLDELFENNKKKSEKIRIKMETDEKKVYSNLEPYARSIGEISDLTGLDIRRTICALVELGIKGVAKETGKGYYVRIMECEPV